MFGSNSNSAPAPAPAPAKLVHPAASNPPLDVTSPSFSFESNDGDDEDVFGDLSPEPNRKPPKTPAPFISPHAVPVAAAVAFAASTHVAPARVPPPAAVAPQQHNDYFGSDDAAASVDDLFAEAAASMPKKSLPVAAAAQPAVAAAKPQALSERVPPSQMPATLAVPAVPSLTESLVTPSPTLISDALLPQVKAVLGSPSSVRAAPFANSPLGPSSRAPVAAATTPQPAPAAPAVPKSPAVAPALAPAPQPASSFDNYFGSDGDDDLFGGGGGSSAHTASSRTAPANTSAAASSAGNESHQPQQHQHQPAATSAPATQSTTGGNFSDYFGAPETEDDPFGDASVSRSIHAPAPAAHSHAQHAPQQPTPAPQHHQQPQQQQSAPQQTGGHDVSSYFGSDGDGLFDEPSTTSAAYDSFGSAHQSHDVWSAQTQTHQQQQQPQHFAPALAQPAAFADPRGHQPHFQPQPQQLLQPPQQPISLAARAPFSPSSLPGPAELAHSPSAAASLAAKPLQLSSQKQFSHSSDFADIPLDHQPERSAPRPQAPLKPPMPMPTAAGAADNILSDLMPAAMQPSRSEPLPLRPSAAPTPFMPAHAMQPAPQQHPHMMPGQQAHSRMQTVDFSAPPLVPFAPSSSAEPIAAAAAAPVASRGPWQPPAAHPTFCFAGFSGQLLVMFPRMGRPRERFGTLPPPMPPGSSAQAGLVPVPGPIVSHSVSALLSDTELGQSLAAFPGPLCRNKDRDRLQTFVTERILQSGADAGSSSSANAREEAQGRRLLWQTVREFLRHQGQLKRGPKPDEKKAGAAAAAEPADSLEQSMVRVLLEPLSGVSTAHAWMASAAAAGHQHAPATRAAVDADIMALVSKPTRDTKAATVAGSLELVEEAKRQDDALAAIQRLLLTAKRQDACQLAIKNQLWAHALLLAGSEPDLYQQVLTQFTLQAFADGAPVQTLYLLLANQPNLLYRNLAASPELLDFASAPPFIRNWRANLAVMLNNPTPNDRNAILQLGDVLVSRFGLTSCAHVCYAMCSFLFDHITQPTARVVLVGGDHRRNLRTFINASTVQMTETIECALKDKDPQAWVYMSHVYKFVYAGLLLDFGLARQALAYVETIWDEVKATAPPSKNKKATGLDNLASPFAPLAFLIQLGELEQSLRMVLNVQKTESRGDRIMSKLFGVFSSGLDMIVGEKSEGSGGSSSAGGAGDKKQGAQQAGGGNAMLGGANMSGAGGAAGGLTTVTSMPYFIIRHPINDVLSPADVAAALKAAGGGSQQQQLQPQQQQPPMHAGQPAGDATLRRSNDSTGFGLSQMRQPSPLTPHPTGSPGPGSSPVMRGAPTLAPAPLPASPPQQQHQLQHQPQSQPHQHQGDIRRPAPIHTRKPSAADLNLAPPADNNSRNSSPNPPAHTRAVSGGGSGGGGNAPATPTPSTPKSATPASPAGGSADGAPRKSLVSKLGGWLGFKQPKQASLRQESSFYFDEKLGRWVQEGAVEEEEVSAPPPPPELSEAMKAKLSAAASTLPAAPQTQSVAEAAAAAALAGASPSAPSRTAMPGPGASPSPAAAAAGLPSMPPPPSNLFGKSGQSVTSRYALSSSLSALSAGAASPAINASMFGPRMPADDDPFDASTTPEPVPLQATSSVPAARPLHASHSTPQLGGFRPGASTSPAAPPPTPSDGLTPPGHQPHEFAGAPGGPRMFGFEAGNNLLPPNAQAAAAAAAARSATPPTRFASPGTDPLSLDRSQSTPHGRLPLSSSQPQFYSPAALPPQMPQGPAAGMPPAQQPRMMYPAPNWNAR